jgi:hypothetical protein
VSTVSINPNFAEGELVHTGNSGKKSFSPKQLPWEPSKIKDFDKQLLEGS